MEVSEPLQMLVRHLPQLSLLPRIVSSKCRGAHNDLHPGHKDCQFVRMTTLARCEED